MGTAWRTGLPGVFIGNTAESVPGQASWSVLAVEREGRVSPATRAVGWRVAGVSWADFPVESRRFVASRLAAARVMAQLAESIGRVAAGAVAVSGRSTPRHPAR
jgi:hypothetical protein